VLFIFGRQEFYKDQVFVYGPLVWSLRVVRRPTIVEFMYVCFEISFPPDFGRYEDRGIPKIEKPMPSYWLCEATNN